MALVLGNGAVGQNWGGNLSTRQPLDPSRQCSLRLGRNFDRRPLPDGLDERLFGGPRFGQQCRHLVFLILAPNEPRDTRSKRDQRLHILGGRVTELHPCRLKIALVCLLWTARNLTLRVGQQAQCQRWAGYARQLHTNGARGARLRFALGTAISGRGGAFIGNIGRGTDNRAYPESPQERGQQAGDECEHSDRLLSELKETADHRRCFALTVLSQNCTR